MQSVIAAEVRLFRLIPPASFIFHPAGAIPNLRFGKHRAICRNGGRMEWRKWGISCTKRGLREESGETSLPSTLRIHGKKMVEHSGFEPLPLTLPAFPAALNLSWKIPVFSPSEEQKGVHMLSVFVMCIRCATRSPIWQVAVRSLCRWFSRFSGT